MTPTLKTCSGCVEVFKATADNFHRHKRQKDGLSARCKNCRAEDFEKYYQANKDKRIQKAKEYHQQHPGRVLEASRKYQKLYPERCALASKRNREKYPERRKEIKRKSRAKEVRGPRDRISHSFSSRVYFSLKGKKHGRSWESLVGYSLDDLMVHLESQFTKGMTWDNHGRGGWHIDHIRPISDFDFDSYDNSEFKQCWSLWNLQPLWESDNTSKGNKCEKTPLPLLTRG